MHQLLGQRVEIDVVAGRSSRGCRPERDRLGQQVERQLVAGGHHDGPLDVVLQLADVARPVVFLQRRQRPRLDVGHVAVVLLVVEVEEVRDQLGDVLAPLAQRRQVDRHDVEPVVQVLAEPALRALRSSRSRLLAAMTRVSTRMVCVSPTRSNSRSCSTRSSLTCSWGVVELISSRKIVPVWAASKRPVRLSIAPVNAPRTWPNSSLSSRLSRECPAVDADERAVAALAQLVDRMGDQLLARARFAEQAAPTRGSAPPAA